MARTQIHRFNNSATTCVSHKVNSNLKVLVHNSLRELTSMCHCE
jgi:hypothetical protein